MIMTRTARQSAIEQGIYDPTLMFNRGLVAQTGCIPEGTMLLQDVWPLVIKATKQIMSESVAGGAPATRVTGVFQVADDINANGRVYPRPILKEAVGAIQEDISNRSVWGEYDHPCGWVPTTSGKGGIRILTVDGWRDFEDVEIGDYVMSRKNGKMIQSRVNGIVNELFDGDLCQFKGRNIDSAFTPGHRFLLLKRPDRGQLGEIYRTAEDLLVAHRVHSAIPRTAKWEGNRPLFVTIPGISEDELPAKSKNRYKRDVTQDLNIETGVFCAFLGIYLAEGGCGDNARVDISQKNDVGRDLIRELLAGLHQDLEWNEAKKGFNLYDIRLSRWLKQCGGLYDKHIPQEIKQLDAEYLEELVYWFAIGDGRMLSAGDRDQSFTTMKSDIVVTERHKLDLGKYTRLSIFTVSKQLIDDLHECVLKVGKCGRLSVITTEEDYEFAGRIIEAKNKQPLHQLFISRSSMIHVDKRFLKIDRVQLNGRIQCLTVDHGNFYMEQNGHSFWTGNSDAKIHLDRISHLITKVWMEGKTVMGEAEIISELPHGAQLNTLLRHGRVGISSRGIGDMEIRENGGQELYYVSPGYRFVTWDAVAEPSVTGAVLQLCEGKLRPIKRSGAKPSYKPVYDRMLVQEVQKYLNKR